MRLRMRIAAIAVAAAVGLAGCEGYSVSFGTTVDQSGGGAFYQVFEVPATSVRPITERTRLAVPPPPDGGASGASTLPAGSGSAGSMPPEAPAK